MSPLSGFSSKAFAQHIRWPFGRGYAGLPLICAACVVLVSWSAKSTSQERTVHSVDPGPKQARCEPGPMPNGSGTNGLSWRMLNEILTVYDGGKLAEPSWARTQWYPENAVRGKEGAGGDADHPTSIKLSVLRQKTLAESLVSKSAGNELGTSTVLFNLEARNAIYPLMAKHGVELQKSIQNLTLESNSKIVKLQFAALTSRDIFKTCSKIDGTFVCRVGAVRTAALPSTIVSYNPKTVFVSLTPNRPCDLKANQISISCFYYIYMPDTTGSRYEDQHDLGEASNINLDLPNSAVYLLQGFHLMKNDVANWTWATYWWTSKSPTRTLFCTSSSRPLGCTMPWSNYNMAAFRFERLNLRDPGVLFNPYIEGSSKSNCIYCHARALYRYPPAKGYAAVDAKAGGAKQDPTVVPCRPDSPSDKAAADVRFNCDPEHMTPTHFLWSLATWLDPGVPKD